MCKSLWSLLFLVSLTLIACNPEQSATPVPLLETEPEAVITEESVALVPQYSIEDFMNSTRYAGASFSPDNSKLLVSHNSTGIFNVYTINVDGSGSEQLTESDSDAMFAVSYFPDDERFLYTADQGGNELNHLYVREMDDSVVDLTPGENLKASFAGWAGDYESFYVQSNERDSRFFDVYEYQLSEGYPREIIFQNDEGFFPAQISPDGQSLVLAELITANNNNLYLQNLESGERTAITPHEGNVTSGPSDFSPDSQWLYYTTDEGSEFQNLMRYELATGAREEVLTLDWDIYYGVFSMEGKYFVAAANVDARTELMMFDAATMERIEAPIIEGANVTSVGFSHGDEMLAMYGSGSQFPGDLFVAPADGSAEPMRLTSSLNANINPEHLVEAEVVRFNSYDGVEIPGVLYVPKGATSENKVPAMVWVHGGPGGQTRATYSGLIQYLVNHGYMVYGINNRGSSGYGKTFYAMDNKQHGEADLGDVVASKQMLIDTGLVDPDKVGIIGGSYGGFMVVAALAFEPEVFNVGIDIFGVTNWLRTLENIPPWWTAQKDALYDEMGDPAIDRERLERISPLFHAETIIKPMMVLQGANDPRVLQVESDEMVAAVRGNDVHVEYIVFPDEGHGFRNRENEIRGYRAIREFLDQYLM
ncbi:MAG: S9 family peptidase [Gammaproteobacteria bacterium]|nr:S9 family peptidase [Gammaproteobacteria bacterium]